MGLDIRLLGPVEAWDDGRRIELGPRKQRLVLAVLGLEAGKPVDVARLVDLAWPDNPPRTAPHAIQVCVSGLRSALRAVAGADIRLHGSGYSLAADPMTIDVYRFRSLLVQSRGTADDLTRVELLDRALALWSGSALAGVAAPQTRQQLCAGLEEARLGAVEDRLDAQLRLGRQRELLDELPGLVASHPLRERLVGQLMIALHRDGRAAEALASFRQYRERLAEELGLDTGPALRELELAILRNDSNALTPSPPLITAPTTPAAPIALSPAAGGSVPAQLPAAVAGFAGRADALAELDALLATGQPTGPIVVIAGTAGVGKTALTVHWGHRHRDSFPDGQLYVNLAGYAPGSPMSPQRALTGFLRALGVPAEKIPLEADEAVALYRSLLADRRMLVVLDNAYAPDQVRPLLPGGPGCLTMVTSRDQLAGLTAKDGAFLLALGVLRTDEALGLLTGLLGARRIDAEAVATAEVATLCACLPLALRIAAAHLIRHPRQPVADLAAELREGNRLTVLSVAGDDQTAVRAAFDLSYATLQPAAQRMFLLAGVAPGADLSTATAAALAAADDAGARELLAELSRAHLVDEHAPGRFAMHDLLRLYSRDRARQEMAAADLDSATSRLFDFYLRATDAAARVLHPNMQRLSLPERLESSEGFGTHAEALGWLEAERPNLVAAVTWEASGDGQREAAWLIADAMRGYFWMRRYAADWLAVAEAGLAAATAGAEPRAMAAAHLSLAQAKRWLARYPDAATHLVQARDLALRAGWDEGAAAALGSLANVYRDQGRLADAAAHHQQAGDIYQRTGSRGGEATSLGNLGNVLLELGRVAEALGYLTRSLAIYQEIGARPAEAHLLNSVGCAHLILGRFPEGLDHLERALELHRETGSREGEADDLNNLAELHRDEGSHAKARELASASLALARESGDQRIEVDANNTLGTVTRLLADPATALRYHQRALETARKAGYRQGEAAALIGLAQDQSDLGQHEEAHASIEQALLTTRQTGLRLLEGHALTALAAIALESGQADEASASAAAAISVHRETGHLLGKARAEAILGVSRADTGCTS